MQVSQTKTDLAFVDNKQEAKARRVREESKRKKLKEEHAVAVAEKAVLMLDCVGVSGQYHLPARLASREGADQHEEGGFWEVKVGEEAGDDMEFVAWAEEDAGLAGMSLQGLTVGGLGAVLKCACGGGADGDDAIPRL